MNAATPHRASLTVLVALAAAAVVAGLIAGAPMIERFMPRMPAMPTSSIAIGFAAVGLLALVVWGIAQLGRAARTRARRIALSATVRGELSGGIRSRLLVKRLNELMHDDADRVRLGARYSIVVDELGVAFWTGGRRPRRAVHFPWPEVRTIRADSTVVGGSVVQVVMLRVRHHGSSIELPIILSSGRPVRFALAEAPFFAVVRSWKAKHRAALAAEGLELPPLTAPIPIITPGMAAAARRGR
jgi:hypothetical protein